jgi:hypothetical protein
MQSRDYLERMIRQIAEAVAKAAGLRAEGRLEEAERAVDEAWSHAFSLRRKDTDRFTAEALVDLLGPKATNAATLLDELGRIEEARGDTGRAAKLYERARTLRGG